MGKTRIERKRSLRNAWRGATTRMAAAVAEFALLLAAAAAWAVPIRVPLEIMMRDAEVLAADAYLPAAEGSWPVVLLQTPYNKNAIAPAFLLPSADDPFLNSPEYAFVVMDWRGFFASAGAAYAGSPTFGEDGHDAVEWVAEQPWSTGAVGTWGPSALGVIQFLTAMQQPPSLRACIPLVASYKTRYTDAFPGGVYQRNVYAFIDSYFGGAGGVGLIRMHPTYDVYWSVTEAITGVPANVTVPMLHIGGWYDHNSVNQTLDMLALQAGGGGAAAGNQKLLMGPWAHSHVGQEGQGQLFYPAAEDFSSVEALAFFDFHLRGIQNGADARAPVRYFRMNDNVWRDASTWPPPGATPRTFFLRGDGSLSDAAPTTDESAVGLSDPTEPIPATFGPVLTEEWASQGPGDISNVEQFFGVQVFSTPVLAQPLTVEGNITADIWITCDAVDTDVVVRLVDVHPNGLPYAVVDHVRRASLRNGFTTRELLQPDTAYRVPVTLPPVAITFPAGHRLQVFVQPSNYDRFDINYQDGSSFSDEEGAVPTAATVEVLMEPGHASSITLPVVAPISASGGSGLAIR